MTTQHKTQPRDPRASRRLRRLARVASAAVLVMLALPATASAGDVGRFGDDVRDRNSTRDGRGARDDDSCDDDDERGTNAWADDSQEAWPSIFALMLVGHTPGDAYNWGASPYVRRGYDLTPGAPVAALGVEAEAPPRVRAVHLVLRGAGAAVPGDPGRGFDAFLKLESSYTPAVVGWYQALWDREAGDRLGFGVYGIEPRMWTGANFSLHYLLGVSTVHDDEGLASVSGAVGIGATVTPGSRLWIDGRLGGHFGAGLVDVSLRVGAETARGVFPYIGARAIGGNAQISVLSVGVAIDLGM